MSIKEVNTKLSFKYHEPMGRFQLELIYYFTYFLPLFHPTLVFLSCGSFVVDTTFSIGLVAVEVSWSWSLQLPIAQARRQKKL